MWAHLGMGYTREIRLGREKADVSPYLNLGSIDPKWREAMDMPKAGEGRDDRSGPELGMRKEEFDGHSAAVRNTSRTQVG